jgi:hypothetical protein
MDSLRTRLQALCGSLHGAKLYHVVADLDLLKLRGEQAHVRRDRDVTRSRVAPAAFRPLAGALLPVQPGTRMQPADR